MPFLGLALLFLVPLVWWYWLVASGLWRHRRACIAAIVATVAWFAVPVLPPSPLKRVAEPLLGVAMLGVMLAPGRLGLLTLRGRQGEADRVVREVSAWLRADTHEPVTASALAERLAPGRFPDARPEWAVSAALFRVSLLRRLGEQESTLIPVTYFERAARSFWRTAIERRLLRPSYAPSAWDEGLVLRHYSERFHALIPTQALADQPLVPLGGWDSQAEALIAVLRTIPLRIPAAVATREAHIDAMTALLTLARGDRSDETIERHRAADELLRISWAKLEDEERRSVEAPAVGS